MLDIGIILRGLNIVGETMKVLSTEKVKVLANRNGWSLAKAEGFVDGETFRRRGKAPSKYAQIGIDEYSLGFREGYYDRQLPGSPEKFQSHSATL